MNNNHVLRVLDIPRKRTALYYITEYLQGTTLRQWMNDNPRASLSTIRNFIRQIAQGLRAFHRQDMIHQDLKPENRFNILSEFIFALNSPDSNLTAQEQIPLINSNPVKVWRVLQRFYLLQI